jgi:rare lipoprotein A
VLKLFQKKVTAGLEIAMNRTGRLPSHLYQYSDQNSLLAKSNASAPQNAQTKQISSANNSANNNAQPQMTDILDQYSSRNVNVAHNVSRPQPIIETQPMNNIQTASGSPVDVVQQQSLSSQIPVNQGNLYVQAGSFSSAENAQALKAALGEIGDVNVQVANIQGRTFHRVRIGPFDTISNADQAMVALEQKGRNGTIVIVD